MAKSNSENVPATPLDPLKFIENVSMQELESQISVQQGVVNEATAKLRSLMSLKKVIAWKDPATRPKRKSKKSEAAVDASAAGETGPDQEDEDAETGSVVVKTKPELVVLRFLQSSSHKHTVASIQRATGLKIAEIERVLTSHPSRFIRDATGGWTVRRD